LSLEQIGADVYDMWAILIIHIFLFLSSFRHWDLKHTVACVWACLFRFQYIFGFLSIFLRASHIFLLYLCSCNCVN
jgi:hypothetical protein